ERVQAIRVARIVFIIKSGGAAAARAEEDEIATAAPRARRIVNLLPVEQAKAALPVRNVDAQHLLRAGALKWRTTEHDTKKQAVAHGETANQRSNDQMMVMGAAGFVRRNRLPAAAPQQQRHHARYTRYR